MFDGSRDSSDPRLVESEARYRAVIENASDMIQSVRPDGTFEFVNRAWIDTLGYSAEEAEQLIIWDIIHPDSLEHCQALFATVMHGQAVEKDRVIFKTKDGRPIPSEGSVTVRMVNGEVIASHAFFRDISEQLRAEELHARNDQLERERLAQYLEKMAALGKLAAGLAHELNNPASAAQRASAEMAESLERLNSATKELATLGISGDDWQLLAGFMPDSEPDAGANRTDDPIAIGEQEDAVADWLITHGVQDSWNVAPGLVAAGIHEASFQKLEDQLPTEALGASVCWVAESLAIRNAVDIVSRSTSRMSDLVMAVKAYSYMDRATEQIVDIHEGLNNTLVILAHRLKNATIHTNYDRSLPPVLAHGSGLNQVWTNIIDNAIDATDGRGTITIETRRSGDRVLVEIADDGCGIPPENLTRIFEPFFTTKQQGSGLGLGLDTAWRILTEEHNGTISVDSRPGRTAFHISLPIAERSTDRSVVAR
jgi:PAS domain S-box-containing protein